QSLRLHGEVLPQEKVDPRGVGLHQQNLGGGATLHLMDLFGSFERGFLFAVGDQLPDARLRAGADSLGAWIEGGIDGLELLRHVVRLLISLGVLKIMIHPRGFVTSQDELASGRPGRRNRLPHLPCCPKVCKLGGAGGFACRANSSHLLTLRGYVEIVAARSEESLEVDLRSQLDLSRRAGDAVADPSKDRRSQNRRAGTKLLSMPERQLHYPVGLNHV